ncbi:MAG TPA: glycosyltransferase family 4 protein [Candidatus Saccharimonadales bacterium]|nr:glycosyltransferase family 4 protein [Candidatus Saccharimonadales bacterium]
MARRVRVLAVDHTAGVPTFRKKFAAIAAHPDIELTVLAPARWVENYGAIEARPGREEGFDLRTGGVGWPGYENRAFFRSGLGSAIREIRPDVLHLWEEPFSVIALQALMHASVWAPRARSIFFSSDNLSGSFRYSYRPSAFYAAVERYAHRRCAAGTAVSEEVAAVLRQKGFSKRIEVVPHGIDPGDYPATPRGPRPPVVGFVGRLLRQKGADLLLRAVASLPHPRPGLAILGDGPEREALGKLAEELGIQDQTRFLPAASHGDVMKTLAAIDVLVLPSRTTPRWKEQFGRVLIEGMAAGCVVVGSSSGAIPEVIGDAGLVFEEESVESLAGAVRRALEEQGLAETLRSRGRRRVEERYTWEAVADRVVGLYRDLVA